MTPGQPARRPRGRPRSNPLPELPAQGKAKATATEDEVATSPPPLPPPPNKKRQRCRSKKYQSGDYITERVKLEEGENGEELDSVRQDAETSPGQLHTFNFSDFFVTKLKNTLTAVFFYELHGKNLNA